MKHPATLTPNMAKMPSYHFYSFKHEFDFPQPTFDDEYLDKVSEKDDKCSLGSLAVSITDQQCKSPAIDLVIRG